MGHKIFVSYKYGDDNVYPLPGKTFVSSYCRDYVDVLEGLFDQSNNVYKGESDGEDLSHLTEDVIWGKLKDRIYDSSLTMILISPGMKEQKPDRDQWIPWEISYSLKEFSRIDKNGYPRESKTNAMIAVVLPDKSNSYGYFIEDRACCADRCRLLKTNEMFNVLKNNMFNQKRPSIRSCEKVGKLWYGQPSYIASVKWQDFITNKDAYIEEAYKRQEAMDAYDISKNV